MIFGFKRFETGIRRCPNMIGPILIVALQRLIARATRLLLSMSKPHRGVAAYLVCLRHPHILDRARDLSFDTTLLRHMVIGNISVAARAIAKGWAADLAKGLR